MHVCPVAAKIPDTTPFGVVYLGVVKNNIGGFAAQLKRHVLDALRGRLINEFAGLASRRP